MALKPQAATWRDGRPARCACGGESFARVDGGRWGCVSCCRPVEGPPGPEIPAAGFSFGFDCTIEEGAEEALAGLLAVARSLIPPDPEEADRIEAAAAELMFAIEPLQARKVPDRRREMRTRLGELGAVLGADRKLTEAQRVALSILAEDGGPVRVTSRNNRWAGEIHAGTAERLMRLGLARRVPRSMRYEITDAGRELAEAQR